MANLMEHSTCVLDISDEEGKSSSDDRGKENIPPVEALAQPVLRRAAPRGDANTASRAVEMADNPRSPLGELDPKSFASENEDVSVKVVEKSDTSEVLTLEVVPSKPSCTSKKGAMQPPPLPAASGPSDSSAEDTSSVPKEK